jgi:pimeloyl-ACP methyl ester carboxylesterase
MSARCWTSQLLGLGGALSVLAVDLPGHGESDPSDAASVEAYADAVAAVLTLAPAGQVIAAGHSLGGAVALALAVRRPDTISGLILLSCCEKIPRSDGAAERLLAVLPGPLRRMVFFSMAKKMLFATGAPANAVSLGMEDLRSCRPETMLKDIRAAQAMDLAEPAAQLDVATLILCGSRDKLTPPALSERLNGLIPRSRLCIIEGAGHMLPLEAADRVNQEILRFAGELGAGAVRAAAVQAPQRRSPAQRLRDAAYRIGGRVVSALGFRRSA